MSESDQPTERTPETPSHSHGPRILLKTDDDFVWPEDVPMFYLVARDGLYVCRNHDLFRSCVPSDRGPRQFAEQATFLRPQFPLIPQSLFEQSVGFFSEIAERHGSEAAALFFWDRGAKCVRLHVPEQIATITRYSDGYVSPIGVHYTPPTDLPEDWIPFADIHCHVNFSAYSSGTDKEDELHSAGLHIVVGRIGEEPPEVHIEAVVDGLRFRIDPQQVIAGYGSRSSDIPKEWLARVDVEQSSFSVGQSWYGSVS